MVHELDLRVWTQRTFLGWCLGIVLLLALSVAFAAAGIRPVQFPAGLAMATGVALCQMTLVKARLGVGWTWVWASALGMSVPFVALDLLTPTTGPTKLLASALLGSVGLALCQYRLLPHHIASPARWVLGTCSGWILSAALVLTTGLTMAIRPPGRLVLAVALLNLLLILVGGVVLGLVTGYTIVQATTTPDEHGRGVDDPE